MLTPTYFSLVAGGPLTASAFSLTQIFTIAASPSGSYSLDGSLGSSVPDGGTTVMLLGAALSGLGLLRRKLS